MCLLYNMSGKYNEFMLYLFVFLLYILSYDQAPLSIRSSSCSQIIAALDHEQVY